jgi:RNA polymerase sigma-70 factor (ECF subfamily)
MRYLLMNQLVRAHTDRDSGAQELNLAGGDARFREVHDRFYRDVYAYCRRRTSTDSVDDAVADTFVTAWRKSDEIPPGDQALPWLYGVAYRVLTHQWRSNFRRGRLTQKVASIGGISTSLPEELVIAGHEQRQVLIALGALRHNDQEILRLTVWEELSHADIAISLGISVGAVRQRFYAAKKKLTDEYNRLESRKIQSPAAQKGGTW